MLGNLVKISPIVIFVLVQISNVVSEEKAPELPPHLQELISEVASNNIQNPADLPTWLLAFFMSYERFRHCATKGTCPKNNAFTNLETLRQKISSYVKSNNVAVRKNKEEKYTKLEETVDPAYYNDELFARQPDSSYSIPSGQSYFEDSEDFPTNDQDGAFSFQKLSRPQSYNYENGYDQRYEQLVQSSFPQYKSYQPRPFGLHNTESQQEKSLSKKSIEFYHHDHSPVHVPLPVHVPVHSHIPVPVPVPVVHSYYQPNYDVYVQCLKTVQICIPSEHCRNGQVHGIEPVPPKTGDFCNIHTHVCCHVPIREEPKTPPRFVKLHKPTSVVNQISNATIKELNNRIIKYIFLGQHNITIPQNETLHILTAENLTNILPELMEGNTTGLYDILHDSNILVNTSDHIMNTIINSTIERVNNYISKYYFLHPNQNISFGTDLDISSTQMTNVETTTEFDISKNLTFQILEDLRNINRTIISLQQNSSSSIEDLNKLITQQTQSLLNIQTTPKQTFEENSDSSFQDVQTTTTTTTPAPRKYLPPDNVYLPPKPSHTYIPQPSHSYIPQSSNVHAPQENIDINQRISESDGLSVPFSDVFGSTGSEASTPIPSTLTPSSTSSQTPNPSTQIPIATSSQANIVNNPVVETTTATTSTQNFVILVDNCPASMSCTREMFCDRTGFITDFPVSEAERVNGVVLMDCENKANGQKGKCCRNRDTTDRQGSLRLIF